MKTGVERQPKNFKEILDSNFEIWRIFSDFENLLAITIPPTDKFPHPFFHKSHDQFRPEEGGLNPLCPIVVTLMAVSYYML